MNILSALYNRLHNIMILVRVKNINDIYITVARSHLTKTPSNVVVEAGTDVTLECASEKSASNITWTHDSVLVAHHCSSNFTRFITTSKGNDCHLTALGNYNVQGLYECDDPNTGWALAVVIVIGNVSLSQ